MTELSALNIKITGDAGDLKAAVGVATSELGKVAVAADRANVGTAQLASGLGNTAKAAGNNSNVMRGMAQQLSQVGQQTMATGDFVQALGIQLPDIGVGFGSVGAAAGLLAGIALPMLVNALSGGADASRTLADALSQVDDAIQNTADLAKVASGDFSSLAEKYGKLTAQILALAEAESQGGIRELADSAKALKEELLDLYSGSGWQNISRAEDLANGLNLSTKAANEMAAAMRVLSNAETLDKQLAVVSLMRTRFEEMVGPVGQMTSDQFAFWTSLKDSEAAMLQLKNRTMELKDKVFDIVGAAKSAATAVAAIGGAASGAMPAVAALASKLWNAASAKSAAQAAVGGGRGTGMGGPALDPYGFRSQLERDNDKGIGNGGGGGGGGGANPIIGELEALQSSLMTQEQLQIESYTRQQETLRAALDQRLITQTEYAAMMEQAQQQHSDKMSAIDVYRYGDGLQKAGAFFGAMADAMASGNDKMLKLGRAFGAAEALINAWRAYAQVLATPGMNPLAKFAAAAKVLAAGMGAVNAIKGGGKTSAGTAGAGTTTQAAASPTQTLNFTISNDPFGFGERIIRQIATQLNQAGRNGMNIQAVVS